LANARLASRLGEDPTRDLGRAWRISGKDHTLKQLERRQIAEASFDLGLDPKIYFNALVKEALIKAPKSRLEMEGLTEVAASLARCGYLDEAVDLMRHFEMERSSNIPMENTIEIAGRLIDAGRVDDALEISRNSIWPFAKAKIALAIARSPHMSLKVIHSIGGDVKLALEPTGWGLNRDGEVFAEWCQLTRQDPMAHIPDHIREAINGNDFMVAEDTTETFARFGKIQDLLGLNSTPTFELAFQAADKIIPEDPQMRSNMDVYQRYNGLVDIATNAAIGRNQSIFDRALSEVKKVGKHESVPNPICGLDLDREFIISETAQNLADQAVELSKAA